MLREMPQPDSGKPPRRERRQSFVFKRRYSYSEEACLKALRVLLKRTGA